MSSMEIYRNEYELNAMWVRVYIIQLGKTQSISSKCTYAAQVG